jgi:hypothetical protein
MQRSLCWAAVCGLTFLRTRQIEFREASTISGRSKVVATHSATHADEVAWLKQQMEIIKQEQGSKKSTTKPVLIITHHAPTMDPRVSAPEHAEGDNRYAFQTDVLGASGIKWAKLGVKAWVSGHTHYTNSFEERGVMLVSNQRGYVFGEVHLTKGKREYDVGRVVVV